jgi:hypothetical protein
MPAHGGAVGGLVQSVVAGATELSRWAVFVRETFQNSNDQRKSKNVQISFNLELRALPSEAREFISNSLLDSGPHKNDEQLGFDNQVQIQNMLVVSDTNTVGLSGSRNAQEQDGANSNFCKFFFYSGQLKKTDGKGGTYGIGRNVLYTASANKTVFAYSAFEQDSKRSTLFMGSSATDNFVFQGLNFQGRHWWAKPTGSAEDNELPSPFIENEADNLARIFGVFDILENTTGTVFIVLNPVIEDEAKDLQLMADAFLINAWPHLLAKDKDSADTIVGLKYFGADVPILDPLDPNSPVRWHAKAYTESTGGLLVRKKDLTFTGSLDKLRPIKIGNSSVMGELRWIQAPDEILGLDSEENPELQSLGLVGKNSIALMRSPKMIVSYRETPAPTDSTTVFGVFIVSESFEEAFRLAENATHDAWISQKLGLRKGAANPIRQFGDKFDQELAFLKPRINIGSDNSGVPVQVANLLGKLIKGLGVTGGGLTVTGGGTGGGGTGGGGGNSGKIICNLSENPRILDRDAEWCKGAFVFSFSKTPKDDIEYHLKATARIWLGSDFEKSDGAPIGAKVPEILGYSLFSEDGSKTEYKTSDSSFVIHGADLAASRQIEIMVRYPAQVQVACSLEIKAT